jgi:hypothetical protein
VINVLLFFVIYENEELSVFESVLSLHEGQNLVLSWLRVFGGCFQLLKFSQNVKNIEQQSMTASAVSIWSCAECENDCVPIRS